MKELWKVFKKADWFWSVSIKIWAKEAWSLGFSLLHTTVVCLKKDAKLELVSHQHSDIYTAAILPERVPPASLLSLNTEKRKYTSTSQTVAHQANSEESCLLNNSECPNDLDASKRWTRLRLRWWNESTAVVLSPNPTSHYQDGVTSSFPDKYETSCSRQVLSLISHEEPQRHSPVSHETAHNCVSSANKHASKY